MATSKTRRLGSFTCALAAAAMTVTGCSVPHVSLATGTREYVASDYPQVLSRWTRSEDLLVLSELDNLLTATATYQSWDFRWAYVVRYAHDYRLTVEQRRTLMTRTLEEARDAHHFYVALYGATRRSTDLTQPNSTWIVRLIDDQGNETAPAKLEAIPKPGPLEKTYFPYTSGFRNAYRIVFPRTTESGRPTIATNAKWFGIRFAGAEGNQELRWELDPAEADRLARATPTTAEF
ncbi:MAG: hypothetical protein U0169_01290 [Polyangiaceae bacterium]